MRPPAQTIVVERDPILRIGIVNTLKELGSINIVAEGITSDDAVRLCRERCPDLVVLGTRKGGGSTAAVHAITKACRETKVVVLTSVARGDHAKATLKAGAHACMLKSISCPELILTVKAVLRGAVLVSPALTALSLHNNKGLARTLAQRERNVLAATAKGYTNTDIAARLKLPEDAVKRSISAIIKKLHVRNRAQAVLVTWLIRSTDGLRATVPGRRRAASSQ